MNRALLVACLLTATAAFAGCTADGKPTVTLTIDFPEPHADADYTYTLKADTATAGVVLAAWSEAQHVPLDVKTFAFGRCLNKIDSLPNPGSCDNGATAFWSLAINGDVAQSGMDEVLVSDGDVVAWTYTPYKASSGSTGTSSTGPTLKVDAPAATQDATVTLTGTLDRDAKVSVPGATPIDAKAGAWSLKVPLEYGRTRLNVTADDGKGTTQAQVLAVRLASATFEAKFTMAVPPHAAVSDLVWYDPDEQASLPLYNGTSTQHPPGANVHDLMATWERQEGKAIEYGGPGDFGFSVTKIDGVGQPLTASAPPYWCYKVNGSGDVLGISAQAVSPGDVVTWEYAGCA